jgi:D-alanyl-D-alanine dipeptidase
MAFDHRSRLDRASSEVGEAGLDGLVVTPGPDLVYLAGYDPPPLERLTALVLRPHAGPVLLVPELERPRAVASPAGELVEVEGWSDGAEPHTRVAGLLAGGRRLGLSDHTWAFHLLMLQRAMPGSEFVPGSRVLGKLRSRKDPEEIGFLRRAGEAADEAFARLTAERLEGRTERDVARSLGAHLLDAGHESVGFTIVASGPHGASPHHEPSRRAIERGDALVLDFGGRIGGYSSDMSRTVSVGEPSVEIAEVHEVVRHAQETAFQAVRPGLPAQEVDRVARGIIRDAGYGEDFIHRTGHGIGLEEHEDPYLVEGNVRPLETGMCFSIEPGIYLPGRFGVRIEDIVAITEDGVARLNDAPRDLLVVG